MLAALLMTWPAACSRTADQDEAPESGDTPRIRLAHTFNPAETEALNQALAEWKRHPVEPTLIPFARGQTMLRRALQSGRDCPDLARVDATWLPALVRDDLVQAVPEARAAARQWLPEAAALATVDGRLYGLPQSLDGLALIYHEDAVTRVPWPPATMDELIAAARRLAGKSGHGLGLRVDGYWFVPFLRAQGADLVAPDIDTPAAARALDRFAALLGARGAPPAALSEDTARRFRARELAAVIEGPWAATDLLQDHDTRGIGVAPLPGAPRGGQLLVVPGCARAPESAWALAAFLTEPDRQAAWARRLGVIPTTRASLDSAGPFARRFYEALRPARPLPRHPITPELFDDLNPAVEAVVAGDATPAEALAGVKRSWQRLHRRNGTPEPAP